MLLGEPFDLRMATAAVLVFAGVAVVRWRATAPPVRTAPVAPLPTKEQSRRIA
jgi:hypothetical protein